MKSLQVIEAPMESIADLSRAIGNSTTVISLLGPSTSDISQAFRPFAVPPYASYYATITALMKQHGVRRIFAMSTISYPDPSGQDRFNLVCALLVWGIYLFVHSAYTAVTDIARSFKDLGSDSGVDWTVFRLAGLPGKSDESSWRRDREDNWPIVGTYVGSELWRPWLKRGALARWLVDCAISSASELAGKFPALGQAMGRKEHFE
jgi:hypothetical protein